MALHRLFNKKTKKKAEEQRETELEKYKKLASLGQIAASIAHEINTPLTNASLNMELLRNTLKKDHRDKDVRQELEIVEKNIDRASAIAKELLRFYRHEESKLIHVNINQVIYSAVASLKYDIDKITISQSLSDVPLIIGDPLKLEQVIINILKNSVEAIPDKGGIFISTSCSDSKVRVEISDTGRGIPEEYLPKVFDPFSTKEDIDTGRGLGLLICHGIVIQHRGEIDIESKEGEGTRVTIRFPVAI